MSSSTFLNTSGLSLDDLEKGDVLLFEGVAGDGISSLIMFLTNSKVSHAAMLYNKTDDISTAAIVHESSPKSPVNITQALKAFANRDIYVCRLSSVEDKMPLIVAADRYLLEKAPYNINGLYLVGIILIYHKFAQDTIKSRIISNILKLAANLATHYINSKKFPDQHPMTCSQFVAQCYDDAGANYRLFTSQLLDQSTDKSLLDFAIDSADLIRKPALLKNDELMSEDKIIIQAEQECEQLLNEMKNPKNDMVLSLPDDELIGAICLFAEKYYELLHPDALMSSNNLKTKLEFLKEQKNLFVSPEDLLSCPKLTQIGVFNASKTVKLIAAPLQSEGE